MYSKTASVGSVGLSSEREHYHSTQEARSNIPEGYTRALLAHLTHSPKVSLGGVNKKYSGFSVGMLTAQT